MQWKQNETRKPLLIRGARQVGKSTLVKQFSQEFKFYISLNLEKSEDRYWFEIMDNVKDILSAICLKNNIQADPKDILFFIDEIQEQPEVIQKLRYFYEDLPQLAVIAAGSLLEFAIRKVPSFPVGRVEQMVLHPFDFEEFLMALKHDQAVEQLNKIPFNTWAHETLLNLFHQYLMIGGMPEVVQQYVKNKSYVELEKIYETLWQSYKDDVEKYASNTSERQIIRHIIDSAPKEKDRITFERFGRSTFRSREVGEALRSLDMARIIRIIYPVTVTEPPLVENMNKSPRLQFLDTGLLNNILNVQTEMFGVKDFNDFYKGKIIHQMIYQELLAQFNSPSYKPHFWVREKSNSHAEVDLVHQYKNFIVPIEIKSGAQGKLRSLHQFMQSTNHPYAVRMSSNKLQIEQLQTIEGKKFLLLNLPYFLGSKLPQYIAWFVDNN